MASGWGNARRPRFGPDRLQGIRRLPHAQLRKRSSLLSLVSAMRFPPRQRGRQRDEDLSVRPPRCFQPIKFALVRILGLRSIP